MKSLAIVFHSAHGHTEHIAQHIATGAAEMADTRVQPIAAQSITATPNALLEFDGIVLGSPTYLGGVSGTFKSFMDATGGLWRTQQLKGKLAAGFTVSSLPAGDKQSTLMSMFVFAMQHGMVWVGTGMLPSNAKAAQRNDVNWLGSSAGLMAQSPSDSTPDEGPLPGDLETARLFGARVAEATTRWHA